MPVATLIVTSAVLLDDIVMVEFMVPLGNSQKMPTIMGGITVMSAKMIMFFISLSAFGAKFPLPGFSICHILQV
ncbi:MAG: hypothetical protein ACI8R9_002047 [Paraglaciecola sp.]|jgi:hypothetical protein